jgi:hypothetical protein
MNFETSTISLLASSKGKAGQRKSSVGGTPTEATETVALPGKWPRIRA